MATPYRIIRTAGTLTVIMSDGGKLVCTPTSSNVWLVRNGVKIVKTAGTLTLIMSDGEKLACTPTAAGVWIVPSPEGPGPDPGTGGWHHPLGPNWPTGTWTTYDTEESHREGAVDFGAGYGGEPPLYAACDGEVIYAGRWGVTNPNYPQSGQSLTLVVRPDGETVGVTYLHMNRIDVSAGDRVTGGQQVGIVGWTGYTDPPGPGGAHLHLEVRSNGVVWGPWERAVPYFASKGVTL